MKITAREMSERLMYGEDNYFYDFENLFREWKKGKITSDHAKQIIHDVVEEAFPNETKQKIGKATNIIYAECDRYRR